MSSQVDLVFIVDCTGSMGSYIRQAQQNIRKIVEDIVASEKADIRFALVCYRDHPPQDSSYITRVFDFTDNIRTMKRNVDTMEASGGGDGPEAVATGLRDALNLEYRKEAAKVCVIIADAPPHGICPSGDGFPNGEPNGVDPIRTAHAMAEKGIVLYSVGCEPAIGGFPRARSFFAGIAQICGGRYVPLSQASLLAPVITGASIEEIALGRDDVMAQLEEEAAAVEDEIEEEVRAGALSLDTEEDRTRVTSTRVQARLAKKGVRTKQLMVDDMGVEAPHSAKFAEAASLSSAVEGLPAEAPPASRARTSRRAVLKKKHRRGREMAVKAEVEGEEEDMEEDMEAESADMFMGASLAECAAPSAPSGEAQRVELVEDTISVAQVTRMVKAKKRSKR